MQPTWALLKSKAIMSLESHLSSHSSWPTSSLTFAGVISIRPTTENAAHSAASASVCCHYTEPLLWNTYPLHLRSTQVLTAAQLWIQLFEIVLTLTHRLLYFTHTASQSSVQPYACRNVISFLLILQEHFICNVKTWNLSAHTMITEVRSQLHDYTGRVLTLYM